ncbi:MAG: protein phosphatase 2C domain-containing protein [Proteobacteria bacterium]|nr:protein phosphatase 2C domain-containing protein [Pseudomonadota bacterium]
MKLIGWGQSDTGRKRNHNEDSLLVDEKLRLFAVADGMGGHRGGATASSMALDVLKRHMAAAIDNLAEVAAKIEADRRLEFVSSHGMGDASDMDTVPALRLRLQNAPVPHSNGDDADTEVDLSSPPALTVMQAAAQEAGFEIFDAALADSSLRGMGTTLTAMLYDSGRMHVVHAGDSRAYLYRNGELDQLTEDHTWIAEQIRSGAMTAEEARGSKYRHIITRSVGFEREVELDTLRVSVEPGDCFLLCSDGMSNYVGDAELQTVMATCWFRRIPEYLTDLANQRGGDDNITVIVVQVVNHTG